MSLPNQWTTPQSALPSSSMSYATGTSHGSQMSRSHSHGASATNFNFDFNTPLDPQLHQSAHMQTHHQTTMGNLAAFQLTQQPASNPVTQFLWPPQQVMQGVQRSRSQADHSTYQDFHMLQTNLSDQPLNQTATRAAPRPARHSVATTRRNIPTHNEAFNIEHGLVYKKARTVAGPDLRSSQQTTFSPIDMQQIPIDSGASQDDLLLSVGTNADAEPLPSPPPHQGFQVNIFQAPETPAHPKIHKLMTDDINTFLSEYRSKAVGEGEESAEELYKQFRLKLGKSEPSTLTSYASSIGAGSAGAETEATAGVKCPKTQKTYFPCPEPGCGKVKSRQSELNKHMHRHRKTYGCVFDKCHKSFGSKNDWKRHESTQHEQQECWRCAVCFDVFFNGEEHYVQHMQAQHPNHPLSRQNPLYFRIARNYQRCFWCGYCNAIKFHNKTDIEAVAHRADHIADHFIKEARLSKDWIEITSHGLTKQQRLEQEQSQSSPDDEQGHSTEPFQDNAQSSSSQTDDQSSVQDEFTQQISETMEVDEPLVPEEDDLMNQQMINALNNHNQTFVPVMHQQQGRMLPANVVQCCYCHTDTNYSLRGSSCSDCQHEFCSNCQFRRRKLR
jgi:hypothetical protein